MEENALFKNAYLEVSKWAKKYKAVEQIPVNEIPMQYDLRNISGIDFTNKVRDQGGCGSCYAMSFVQVLEVRLKIKTGKPVPQLSAQ